MKKLLLPFALGIVVMVGLGAGVKISDLALSTSPSTNTFLEIADLNATGTNKSAKILYTNLVTQSQLLWESVNYTNNFESLPFSFKGLQPITLGGGLAVGTNGPDGPMDWNYAAYTNAFLVSKDGNMIINADCGLSSDPYNPGSVLQWNVNMTDAPDGVYPLRIVLDGSAWSHTDNNGFYVVSYTKSVGSTKSLYWKDGVFGIIGYVQAQGTGSANTGQGVGVSGRASGKYKQNYGVVGGSQNGSANYSIGVAGTVLLSGAGATNTGGYFEITTGDSTSNADVVLNQTSALTLDNRTSGASLIVGRTNNGTVVFNVGPGGTAFVSGLTNNARTASTFVVAAADKSDTSTATSAVLASTLTDETGTGVAVFDTSPTFTTSANFPAGSASVPSVAIGTTTNGFYASAANTIDVTTSGTDRWKWSSSGHFLAATDATYDIGASGATRPRNYFGSGNGVFGGDIQCGSGNGVGVNGRFFFSTAVNGNIRFTDWAGTSFGLLQLGGTTTSYPAIKRNGPAINIRLADDSGDAVLTYLDQINVGSGVTLSTTNRFYLVNVDAQTVTLPTAAGAAGKTYSIKVIAPATSATVATTSSQLIDGASTYSLTASNKYVRVTSDGTNWWNFGSN